MTYNEKISRYINGLIDVLQNLDIGEINQYIEVVEQARQEGKNIFIFGNGGSGATASHMMCDFNKGLSHGQDKRFKMICLNDNMPTMMACANDISYEDIFVEPLKNFLKPKDVVIGISGSGNSMNIVKAIDYANKHGALTVGLCGFDGGKLKKCAKMAVHIKIKDMQKAEDMHMVIAHIVYQALQS